MEAVEVPLFGGRHSAIVDADIVDALLPYHSEKFPLSVRISDVSWHEHHSPCRKYFYAASGQSRSIAKKKSVVVVKLHRLVIGAKPGEIVDHINRNKLDNRRSNLRIATPRQNSLNREATGRTIAPYRGLGWALKGQIWGSYIRVGGSTVCLGSTRDPVYAARMFDAAARMVHGSDAVVNFPGEPLVELRPKVVAKILAKLS